MLRAIDGAEMGRSGRERTLTNSSLRLLPRPGLGALSSEVSPDFAESPRSHQGALHNHSNKRGLPDGFRGISFSMPMLSLSAVAYTVKSIQSSDLGAV